MNVDNAVTAGNKGDKVKQDCFVTLESGVTGGLDIQIDFPGDPGNADAIKALAEDVCGFFGMTSASLRIEDRGAPDFVLCARIEACIKKVMDSGKNYLPEMKPENLAKTTKNRMRMSRLYIPGNTPKMMLKSGTHGSHAIIFDLEDAVAPAKKAEARLLVRNGLRQVDFNGAERMVRINQLPLGLEDLEQLVPHNVHILLIPKCESGEDIKAVNARIKEIQQGEDNPETVYLMPIVETCRGLLNAAEIAAAGDNLVALTIGLEDYTADLGVQRTVEGTESFYARSHLAVVCKAHGLQAIDSVFSNFGDPEGLAATVRRSKSLGYQGMGCIHPTQIPVVHEGYAPEPAEIEKAQKIVDAFEEAGRKGLGVVSLGTKMIDPPVVDRAFQVIEKAAALNLLPQNR